MKINIVASVMLMGLCFGFTDGLDASEVLPSACDLLNKALVAEGDQARLRVFFDKANRGEKIVIGVLGGSITSGAACSNPDKRYHGVMLQWFRKRFPKSDFVLVNAGVGGTGSDYGALRVNRDIISRQPDLVILEYGVNDKDTAKYAESYEGVVRQILKCKKRPALILLFMMWHNGKNAQKWQTKIGMHYNLPMLSYRDALWPEIVAKRLQWRQLSPDIVHPNEQGHIFAGELICAFLDKARNASLANTALEPASISGGLPVPVISNRYENCVLLEAADLKPISNKGWTFKSKSRKVPAGWFCNVPGSVIEFELHGKAILLSHWLINGPMGMVAVSIDGAKPVMLDAWFKQKWGGKRAMTVVGDELKQGKHIVKIELMEAKNSESTGNEFCVLCIGSAGAQINN